MYYCNKTIRKLHILLFHQASIMYCSSLSYRREGKWQMNKASVHITSDFLYCILLNFSDMKLLVEWTYFWKFIYFGGYRRSESLHKQN